MEENDNDKNILLENSNLKNGLILNLKHDEDKN